MANAIYPLTKQALMSGSAGVPGMTLRAMLLQNTYSYNAAHEFLSDVSGATRGPVCDELDLSVSVSSNVISCDSANWTGATTSNACNAILFYNHTGTEGTSRLLAYMDTATGLPIGPLSSDDVTLTVDPTGLYAWTETGGGDLVYLPMKNQILTGYNLTSADLRLILVDNAEYTASASHEFLSSIPGAARVAVSSTLGGVSVTNGTLTFTGPTFPTVTGASCESLVLYDHNGGSDAARRLVAYRVSDAGLPISPDGRDITYTVNASGFLTMG